MGGLLPMIEAQRSREALADALALVARDGGWLPCNSPKGVPPQTGGRAWAVEADEVSVELHTPFTSPAGRAAGILSSLVRKPSESARLVVRDSRCATVLDAMLGADRSADGATVLSYRAGEWEADLRQTLLSAPQANDVEIARGMVREAVQRKLPPAFGLYFQGVRFDRGVLWRHSGLLPLMLTGATGWRLGGGAIFMSIDPSPRHWLSGMRIIGLSVRDPDLLALGLDHLIAGFRVVQPSPRSFRRGERIETEVFADFMGEAVKANRLLEERGHGAVEDLDLRAALLAPEAD